MFLLTLGHPVLHPRYKLEYFKQNNGDDESIDTTHELVQDTFDRSYWLLDVEGDNNHNTTHANRDITVCCSFSSMLFLLTLNTGVDIISAK
jgi:hypothetical protein